MNPSPIYMIQHQLLQIIDSACATEQTSQYACDCINSLTRFIRTGMYKNQNSNSFSLPNLIPSLPTPINPIPIIPQMRTMAPSSEVERVESRLSGFNYKLSAAWSKISELFTSEVKQVDLRRIAEHISNKLGICLDRDAKRRKSVLLKWFDENWAQIKDILSCYKIEGENIYYNGKILSYFQE